MPFLARPLHAKEVNNQIALWVWKDRVTSENGLYEFAKNRHINTLFIYVSPETAKNIIAKNNNALHFIKKFRDHGIKLYALVGEPDWAWPSKQLPEHAKLALELVSNASLFDGVQFDVEPHSLEEWATPHDRTTLAEGLVSFYRNARGFAKDANIEAAVNPIYASINASKGDLLEELFFFINSISIMAYRKDLERAIEWASPSIKHAEKSNRGWRMGISVDDSDPSISWRNLSKTEFDELVATLPDLLCHGRACNNFLGIAIHDYDGLKNLLTR